MAEKKKRRVAPAEETPPAGGEAKEVRRGPTGTVADSESARALGKMGGRPKGSKGFARRVRDAMWAEHGAFVDEAPVGGTFLEKVVAVANCPAHPHWPKAVEFLAKRGYGREPETVVVQGNAKAPLHVEHQVTHHADATRVGAILEVLERAGALTTATRASTAAQPADSEADAVRPAPAHAASGGLPPAGGVP